MHKHDMSELVSQTLQSTLVPIKASCISVEYRMSIIYIYIWYMYTWRVCVCAWVCVCVLSYANRCVNVCVWVCMWRTFYLPVYLLIYPLIYMICIHLCLCMQYVCITYVTCMSMLICQERKRYSNSSTVYIYIQAQCE